MSEMPFHPIQNTSPTRQIPPGREGNGTFLLRRERKTGTFTGSETSERERGGIQGHYLESQGTPEVRGHYSANGTHTNRGRWHREPWSTEYKFMWKPQVHEEMTTTGTESSLECRSHKDIDPGRVRDVGVEWRGTGGILSKAPTLVDRDSINELIPF